MKRFAITTCALLLAACGSTTTNTKAESAATAPAAEGTSAEEGAATPAGVSSLRAAVRTSSPSQSLAVGPDAGTMALPDGFTLEWPAGTFGTAGQLTVTRLEARQMAVQLNGQSVELVSAVYEVRATAPFAQPIALHVPVTSAEVDQLSLLGFQDPSGWREPTERLGFQDPSGWLPADTDLDGLAAGKVGGGLANGQVQALAVAKTAANP